MGRLEWSSIGAFNIAESEKLYVMYYSCVSSLPSNKGRLVVFGVAVGIGGIVAGVGFM